MALPLLLVACQAVTTVDVVNVGSYRGRDCRVRWGLDATQQWEVERWMDGGWKRRRRGRWPGADGDRRRSTPCARSPNRMVTRVLAATAETSKAANDDRNAGPDTDP